MKRRLDSILATAALLLAAVALAATPASAAEGFGLTDLDVAFANPDGLVRMQGAKKGLLVNSTNLCKGTHNGKIRDFRPKVRA